jgi:hypothetical protein
MIPQSVTTQHPEDNSLHLSTQHNTISVIDSDTANKTSSTNIPSSAHLQLQIQNIPLGSLKVLCILFIGLLLVAICALVLLVFGLATGKINLIYLSIFLALLLVFPATLIPFLLDQIKKFRH